MNATDSKIKRLVDCSANAGADDLLIDLDAKKNSTVQVGGAGGAGGALTLKMESFAVAATTVSSTRSTTAPRSRASATPGVRLS